MLAPACTSNAITQEAAFCAACRGQTCQRRLDQAQKKSKSRLRQVCKMLLTTKLTFKASWNTARSHSQYLATCVKLYIVKRPLQIAAQAKAIFTCPETPVLCTTSFVDIFYGIHNTACLASKLPATGTVGVSSFHT